VGQEIAWKTIPIAPKYEVNELGQVRHKKLKRILKYAKGRRYYKFDFYVNKNQKKSVSVHRAILSAFNPIKDFNEFYINHKNLDKHDNRLENLEWVTPKENAEHAREHGKYKDRHAGEKNGKAKYTDKEVLELKNDFKEWGGTIYNFWKNRKDKYENMPKSTIYNILNGRSWKHI